MNMKTHRARTVCLVPAVLAALAGLARAQGAPEAVFAGPLDATERPADRRRLSEFAGFIERNAGKVVRLAIQLRAPKARPTSVFSSWARLTWRLTDGKLLEGKILKGVPLANAIELSVAFCRCDGNLEAPYHLDFKLAATAGAQAPDLSWADGRLLVRGRFRIVGPSRVAPMRHFNIVPAPKAGGGR